MTYQDAIEKAVKLLRYPDQYLHVVDCRSGETWIVPIGENASLDLTHNVEKWIAASFCGECELDGKIMSKLEGDYYAQILLAGCALDGGVCWQSGGFYLKATCN